MENNKNTQALKIEDAIAKLSEQKKTKFTSSVDVDVVLQLKDKQLKESIRGSVDLPNSFGDPKKVVVICDKSRVKEALAAGAVAAGLEDIQEKITKNEVDFDVVIATPDVMPKIVALGKVLGPKGLMPSPKNGTITDNIAAAVESFKGGKVNFKMEQGQGVIRGKIGDVSMSSDKIQENFVIFMKSVFNEAKKLTPNPFKKVILTTTMGSGIKVDVNDIMSAV
jgi:large subunit ribosomal protein L1